MFSVHALLAPGRNGTEEKHSCYGDQKYTVKGGARDAETLLGYIPQWSACSIQAILSDSTFSYERIHGPIHW